MRFLFAAPNPALQVINMLSGGRETDKTLKVILRSRTQAAAFHSAARHDFLELAHIPYVPADVFAAYVRRRKLRCEGCQNQCQKVRMISPLAQ